MRQGQNRPDLRDRPVAKDRRALLAGAGALAAVAGLSTLVACSRTQAPVDDQGRVRIRFATDSLARAEHGGFYQAVASGAYAKRGLNVEIVQGGPNTNIAQLLATGSVELALAADSAVPFNLLAQGAPVKAVAAFFQKSLEALIAHPDPALKTLTDLKDRPILLPDAARILIWPWLKTQGFTDEHARRLPENEADILKAFRADDKQVQLGALTTAPYAIEQADRTPPQVFLLADAEYPAYGGLVLSTDGFARDNATALRNFIAGSAEGWRDYINGNPKAADALIRSDNPAMDQGQIDHARTALKTNGVIDGGDAALYGLGTMTTDRWQAFFDTAVASGAYSPDLNWRKAYTDIYLPGRG